MEVKGRHRTDTEGMEVAPSKKPEKYRNTDQSWRLAETGAIRRAFDVRDGGARVTVDPTDADLELTGHMGETVLTVDAGESLPEDVRERVTSLDRTESSFDGTPETWDRQSDDVQYREARLEPGDSVHVTGGVVENVPDDWGSEHSATVGAAASDERYLISEGTETDVVRTHLVKFSTGFVVGLALLGLGLYVLRSTGAL